MRKNNFKLFFVLFCVIYIVSVVLSYAASKRAESGNLVKSNDSSQSNIESTSSFLSQPQFEIGRGPSSSSQPSAASSEEPTKTNLDEDEESSSASSTPQNQTPQINPITPPFDTIDILEKISSLQQYLFATLSKDDYSFFSLASEDDVSIILRIGIVNRENIEKVLDGWNGCPYILVASETGYSRTEMEMFALAINRIPLEEGERIYFAVVDDETESIIVQTNLVNPQRVQSVVTDLAKEWNIPNELLCFDSVDRGESTGANPDT